MAARIQCLLLAASVIHFGFVSAPAEQPLENGKEPPKKVEPPDPALISKLIKQLGSATFSERVSASKQIEEIGESALDPLRKAAKVAKDVETRRRVEQVYDRIELTVLEAVVLKGKERYRRKDYENAAELFNKAIKMGQARFISKDPKARGRDIPFLSEVQLLAARNWRALRENEKAANAFISARSLAGSDRDRRSKIEGELDDMIAQMLAGWNSAVKLRIHDDPPLKKLVSKYPLVLLHSRRYAGGGYLQAAYSFLHETTDERKHYNDVQILFDNGKRNSNFYINMVVGQMNRVADLGPADFERNPDPAKVGVNDKIKWSNDECKAIDGHVYLEHVKDDQGNDFFVLFRALAVDKDSKYFAFVWRRLPGGKTVKQR